MLFNWIRPYTLLGIVIWGYRIHTSIISSQTDSPANEGSVPEGSMINSSCILYQICVSAETAAGFGEEACIISSRSGGTVFDHFLCTNTYYCNEKSIPILTYM